MKTLIQIFKCVNLKLKNFFFNSQKSDIYHDCEAVLGTASEVVPDQEKNDVEEYMKNYTSTTRWQTV